MAVTQLLAKKLAPKLLAFKTFSRKAATAQESLKSWTVHLWRKCQQPFLLYQKNIVKTVLSLLFVSRKTPLIASCQRAALVSIK